MPDKLRSIKNKIKKKRENKSQGLGNHRKEKSTRKATKIAESKELGDTKGGVLWSHRTINVVITPDE